MCSFCFNPCLIFCLFQHLRYSHWFRITPAFFSKYREMLFFHHIFLPTVPPPAGIFARFLCAFVCECVFPRLFYRSVPLFAVCFHFHFNIPVFSLSSLTADVPPSFFWVERIAFINEGIEQKIELAKQDGQMATRHESNVRCEMVRGNQRTMNKCELARLFFQFVRSEI